MMSDNNLKATARNLRESGIRSGMPKGLTARILSALPPEALSTTGRFAKTSFPRWAGVIAVVGVVAVLGGYRYERLHQQSRLLSKKTTVVPLLTNPGDPTVDLRNRVRAAVDHTNTVHLLHRSFIDQRADSASALKTTERLEDHWEVWQRKSPYFFREERGGEILLDDGKTQYHFVPAYTVQDVRRDLQAYTPPVMMSGRDGRPAPTQRQEIESWRAHLSTSLRPAILQIRPSSGAELSQADVGRNEPEHLFLGTDKKDGRAVDITGTPGAPPVRRTETNTLSIDLTRKAAGESAINEVRASVNLVEPHTTRIESQTNFVVDAHNFLPKRSKVTENIDSIDSNRIPRPLGVAIRSEITADYDRTIPKRLFTIDPPPDTIVFDVSVRADPGPKNSPLPANLKGLAVSAALTECDASLDVKYTLKWTFDGKPVSYRELSRLASLSLQSVEMSDAMAGQYMSIMNAGGVTETGAENIAVRVEPVLEASARPKEIIGSASVLLSGNSPGAQIYVSHPQYLAVIPFTLDLRRANDRGASAAPMTVGLADKRLTMLAAAARGDFYIDRIKTSPTVAHYTNTKTDPKRNDSTLNDRERAFYWLNQAITAANAAGRPGEAKAYAWKLKTIAAQLSRRDSIATAPHN